MLPRHEDGKLPAQNSRLNELSEHTLTRAIIGPPILIPWGTPCPTFPLKAGRKSRNSQGRAVLRAQSPSVTPCWEHVNMRWLIVALFIVTAFDMDLNRSGCGPSILYPLPWDTWPSGQSWGGAGQGQRQESLQGRLGWVLCWSQVPVESGNTCGAQTPEHSGQEMRVQQCHQYGWWEVSRGQVSLISCRYSMQSPMQHKAVILRRLGHWALNSPHLLQKGHLGGR